jgi:hypothetical protein
VLFSFAAQIPISALREFHILPFLRIITLYALTRAPIHASLEQNWVITFPTVCSVFGNEASSLVSMLLSWATLPAPGFLQRQVLSVELEGIPLAPRSADLVLLVHDLTFKAGQKGIR